MIVDPDGDVIAAYAPGITRQRINDVLAAAHWMLDPDGSWTNLSPPDGQEHPIVPVPEPPRLSPTTGNASQSDAAPPRLPQPEQMRTHPAVG